MASTVAAISQLVATGAIDQELTKNPSVTYWRYQHFRHTAFALENQILLFSSGNQLHNGGKSTCTLHRSGDLVSRMYVIIDLPGIANVSDTTIEFGDGELKAHLATMGMVDTSKVTADATTSPGEAVEADIAAAYAENGGTPLSDVASSGSQTGGSVPYWCNGVGFRLIKEASLLIGSQTIDTVYSDFLFMFNELSKKPQKSIDEMIGCGTPEELKKRSKFYRRLHVPLPFFCTKTTGSALPIVSLQFHTVQVSIDWNDLSTCIVNHSGMLGQNIEVAHPDGTDGKTVSLRTVVRVNEQDRFKTGTTKVMTVYGQSKSFGGHVQSTVPPGIVSNDVIFHLECMYVYLDLAERSKFSSGSFQLLMSEAQKNNSNSNAGTSTDVEIDLNFNHAVIELMWAVRTKADKAKNNWFDYGGVVEPVTGMVRDPVKNVKLTLNNSNRFTGNNSGSYFRTIQPYQHHSNIPKSFVYSYSFGLFPESENPSGQANFSRIDSKKLHLTLDSNIPPGSDVIVFARNWNLLRVTLGLAGKAYAN